MENGSQSLRWKRKEIRNQYYSVTPPLFSYLLIYREKKSGSWQ